VIKVKKVYKNNDIPNSLKTVKVVLDNIGPRPTPVLAVDTCLGIRLEDSLQKYKNC